jgi:hypothetical protein
VLTDPHSFASKREVLVNPTRPAGSVYLLLDRLQQLRGSNGWEFRLGKQHMQAAASSEISPQLDRQGYS